jgi:F-type H+-transporting ATPase subunit epsilon
MALELVVVTPEGEAFSEAVQQVVLPGEAGRFGVLESHERFLTPLVRGPMQIIKPGGATDWAALSSGFAEVDGQKVIVLVDGCAMKSEIDRNASENRRAEAARQLVSLADTPDNAGERLRLSEVVASAELELEVAGL